MSSISATVVGAGLMGRWHAHALARAGGQLTGVVDPDAGAADRLASRYSPASSFRTLEEALGGGPPGVVHVCAPLDSHASLVEAALGAGAHVLVEKPLAPTLEVTERLLDMAQERELLLCPCHQYPFQRGVGLTRVALPTIGPLLHAEATACSAGGHGGEPGELDGVAADILPHPLSVLQSLLPTGLDDAHWRSARPRVGELRAEALVGDLTVTILISMNGRPPRNELRLIGARGTARIDFFHGFATVQRARASRAQKVAEPFHTSALTAVAAARNLGERLRRWEPAYPGLRTLIEQFYSAARSNGLSPISRRDAIAVAVARDRVIDELDQGN